MAADYDYLLGQLAVDDDVEQKTNEGLAAAFAKLKMELQTNSHGLLGSKHCAGRTKSAYLKHCRGMFRFFARIGAYECLLVLHTKTCSTKIPSMDANYVALYLLYKTGAALEPLKRIGYSETVMDVNGNPVLCCGEWHDLGNVNQFLSTITAVHRTISQGGTYKEACADCNKSLVTDGTSNGCFNHHGSVLFWRSGNPRDSNVVNDVYKRCKKNCEHHQITSCYQLLPEEVQQLRRRLLSTNSLVDLQYYCMLLVSTYIFLRCDEICNMQFCHFTSSLSSIESDGKVQNLVFKVKGKKDNEWKHMILWRTDDVPSLCPVRHLLLFVYLQGRINTECRNSQFIFADYENNQSQLSYVKFLYVLKNVFLPVLGRETTLTTHVFRKTGYLFAVFGGGQFDVIRVAARHTNSACAMLYHKDALTMKAIKESAETQNLDNNVPTWRSSYIEITATVTLIQQKAYNLSLHDVAEKFIIATNATPSVDCTIHNFVKRLYSYHPGLSAEKQLCGLIRDLPASTQHKILRLFQAKPRERRTINDEHQSGNLNVDNSITNANNYCDHDSDTGRHIGTYKRKAGNNDLDGRKKLKQMKDARHKLEALLTLHTEAVSELTDKRLTESARIFYHNTLQPIYNCFSNHCNSDVDAFLVKWDITTGLYRFKRQCCDGVEHCKYTVQYSVNI